MGTRSGERLVGATSSPLPLPLPTLYCFLLRAYAVLRTSPPALLLQLNLNVAFLVDEHVDTEAIGAEVLRDSRGREVHQ
jgi:hypothetical protein